MNAAVRAFDAFAERYDARFRGDQGRVIFPAEVEAVRTLLPGLRPPSWRWHWGKVLFEKWWLWRWY